MKFHWEKEQRKALKEIEELLCTAPVLEYPQFDEPLIITTNASNFALSAVLSQGEIGKDRAWAYASRSLHKAETKYRTYEKEALAIMFAIKTFKNYVYGNKFRIVTDHKPLLWLKSADNNTRIQKWGLKLSDYEFDILYKPGKQNANADSLSRNPVELSVVTRAQNKREISQNTQTTKVISNHHKIKAINDEKLKWKTKRRPRKNNAKNPKLQKENVIKNIVITNTQKLNNIIYSKNSIQFRNDNIVNLINLNGNY